MSEYSQVLGDTVRAARKKMGLSQNKVAALIDADERTIMNIETYNANTTMNVLYPLIRILRIDPRDIYCETTHFLANSAENTSLKNSSEFFRFTQVRL